MNILELSPYNFTRGGSDKYFLQTCKLLEASGHEVYKFCTNHSDNETASTAQYFPEGINTQSFSPINAARLFYNFSARSSLDDFLENHHIDVAHIHIYYGQFTTSVLHALKSRNIPIVQTIHDYKPVCPVYSLNRHGEICTQCEGTKFYKCIMYKCNRGSLLRSVLSATESYTSNFLGANRLIDRMILVCNYQAETFSQFGIESDKLSVLYNFTETKQSEFRTLANKKRFLYFGRIEESKGLRELVTAFANIDPLVLNEIELVIAGTGEFSETLGKIVKETGLKQIKIVGHIGQDELVELANQSFASILVPHAIENCSMAVLESLGMGVPVIASRIGALPELITHGENGLLIDVGDVESLKTHMEQLATSPELVAELSLKSVERAEKQFNPLNHVNELIEIFNNTIMNYPNRNH